MHPPTVTVTTVGGPTVLLDVAGVRLLTDPTFDAAGTRFPLPGAAVTKQRGPAVAATDLGRIDAVLLSHDQHPDNLDRAGRALLAHVPTVLTTPAAAARLGHPARALRPGDRVEVTGPDATATVTATTAVHGPSPVRGMLGDVTGFLIRPAAGAAIWVSGDTVTLDSAAEAAAAGPVGLAVLHAGAARLDPLGPHPLTFTAEQAVAAARLVGDCPVLVVHDDGWSHLTQDHADIEAAFARHGLAHRLLTVLPGRPRTVTTG